MHGLETPHQARGKIDDDLIVGGSPAGHHAKDVSANELPALVGGRLQFEFLELAQRHFFVLYGEAWHGCIGSFAYPMRS
jgi:hypothetical protein